jgi:hypothetical protein
MLCLALAYVGGVNEKTVRSQLIPTLIQKQAIEEIRPADPTRCLGATYEVCMVGMKFCCASVTLVCSTLPATGESSNLFNRWVNRPWVNRIRPWVNYLRAKPIHPSGIRLCRPRVIRPWLPYIAIQKHSETLTTISTTIAAERGTEVGNGR